jgi:hypothetical protein
MMVLRWPANVKGTPAALHAQAHPPLDFSAHGEYHAVVQQQSLA